MARKLGTREAQAIGRRIARLESFDTHGSFYGRPVADGREWYRFDTGWLRGTALDRFRADADSIDYIVFSYGTPIQWHAANGWVRIGHAMSATTGRHQSSASAYRYASPADDRETVLQVSYGLSAQQLALFWRIRDAAVIGQFIRTRDVTGQASRTLTVLYRRGLVESDAAGVITITAAGAEVWA